MRMKKKQHLKKRMPPLKTHQQKCAGFNFYKSLQNIRKIFHEVSETIISKGFTANNIPVKKISINISAVHLNLQIRVLFL